MIELYTREKIVNEYSRSYLPLQAMITLLKPTNTPLLGLLNERKKNESDSFEGMNTFFYLTIEIIVDLDKRHHVCSL